MSAEKEIRRTNAWVRRRISPRRMPRDEKPITDYEFQIPSDWLDNSALWAKYMLVIITLSMIAGYASVFLWVFDNVGHFR